MKRIFIILLIAVGFWSCEKDEVRAILDPNAALQTATLSSPNVVLSKDEADNNVLTISWTAPSYGYAAAPSYMLYIDKEGGDFSRGYATSTGTALQKVFRGSELNALLLNLGLKPGEEHKLNVLVKAVLSNAFSISSPVGSLNATPYSSVLDLSSPWGVVGSAYNDWGATPDGPFYKTTQNEVYVAYVTLKDGEIKFRKDSGWDVNYGDNGADGTLEAGGDNIRVTAGTYKITMNLNTFTYTLEKYSWGIVGSAFNDWGATPDGKMVYDPYSDQWRTIITLKAGEMKFRLNSDWGVNFGDNGANGTLDAGGDNIQVTAGKYLVTMNLNDNSYSILPVTHLWGVVGDATPNGWNGPDVPMDLDYSKYEAAFDTKGVWIAHNVVLKAGEIKFRADNDWGVNYGDTGADGSLEAGGDNIKVTAGTYDIVLDFSGPTPTYKLTRK